jgi:hypothetical protein
MPGSRHAVASIVESVRRHMYAPTTATAGLRLSHHHTHVVPNQVPAMPSTSASAPPNAYGGSPLVSIRPAPKKRFALGCTAHRRTGRPAASSTGVFASGGPTAAAAAAGVPGLNRRVPKRESEDERGRFAADVRDEVWPAERSSASECFSRRPVPGDAGCSASGRGSASVVVSCASTADPLRRRKMRSRLTRTAPPLVGRLVTRSSGRSGSRLFCARRRAGGASSSDSSANEFETRCVDEPAERGRGPGAGAGAWYWDGRTGRKKDAGGWMPGACVLPTPWPGGGDIAKDAAVGDGRGGGGSADTADAVETTRERDVALDGERRCAGRALGKRVSEIGRPSLPLLGREVGVGPIGKRWAGRTEMGDGEVPLVAAGGSCAVIGICPLLAGPLPRKYGERQWSAPGWWLIGVGVAR